MHRLGERKHTYKKKYRDFLAKPVCVAVFSAHSNRKGQSMQATLDFVRRLLTFFSFARRTHQQVSPPIEQRTPDHLVIESSAHIYRYAQFTCHESKCNNFQPTTNSLRAVRWRRRHRRRRESHILYILCIMQTLRKIRSRIRGLL
jgi:hypothetical protein